MSVLSSFRCEAQLSASFRPSVRLAVEASRRPSSTSSSTHPDMSSCCFPFRRLIKPTDDLVRRDSDHLSFRTRIGSSTDSSSSTKKRVRGGSDVQQHKEKCGAITFESAYAGKMTVMPDARIPLTPRQCFVLVQNWKGLSGRLVSISTTMLARLFEKNDTFLRTFDESSTTPTNQEPKSLELHAVNISRIFNDAIRAIGDPDRFFDTIKKCAQFHSRIPSFQPDYFRAIEQPFLYAIKITLDDRYTEQMDYIYKLAIHLIVDTMVEECDAELKADAFE